MNCRPRSKEPTRLISAMRGKTQDLILDRPVAESLELDIIARPPGELGAGATTGTAKLLK